MKSRHSVALSLALTLVSGVTASASYGASVEFNPSPIKFAIENEVKTVGFYLNNIALEGQGPEEAELLKIDLIKGNAHYVVNDECSGAGLPKRMVAKEGESKPCLYKAVDFCPGMEKGEAEAEYELPPGAGKQKITVLLEK